jgi:hypothetical protein
MLKSIQLTRICYLFFVSFIYAGCSEAATTGNNNSVDSTKRNSSSSVKASKERPEYNEAADIKNMIREMSQICEHPVSKDTVFIMGNDTVSIAFNHSCTGDSFLLPAKYIETYKMDHFMAHSLKSDIIIKKNGVKLLGRRIEKKDFGSLVEGDLKDYAVLLYPIIERENDTIYIDYSISVPLTDVGIGVRASIKKDGSIQFGRN